MRPDKYTLYFWKGASFYQRFTFLEGGTGSDPRDLTNYTGVWTVKDQAGGSVLGTYTDPANITFGGLAGTIDLGLSAATTAALTYTNAVYELLVTAPGVGGRTDPLLFGPVIVSDI